MLDSELVDLPVVYRYVGSGDGCVFQPFDVWVLYATIIAVRFQYLNVYITAVLCVTRALQALVAHPGGREFHPAPRTRGSIFYSNCQSP